MLPKRLVGWLKDTQNKITERKAREQIKSKDAISLQWVSKLTGSWNSHYSPGKLRKTLWKNGQISWHLMPHREKQRYCDNTR